MRRSTTWLALWLISPAAVLAQERGAKEKPDTPALRYEQFRRSVEVQVEEKREEQIRGLQRLLELDPDPDELPDIRFRLAELYFEKSRFFFFRAQEARDDGMRTEVPSEKEAAVLRQKEFEAKQAEWTQQSLQAYQGLRREFPRYIRMPEVLFALGQAYWNLNRQQDSVNVYAELIRNHVDSPLVSEAWLAFGEFYFNEADVNKALASYQKAAEDKRSRVYGFALYKQGWCHYNMADWGAALKKFRATVIYAQLATELSGENKIALGREAQGDFVRTYAHIGSADRAEPVFAELLGENSCATGRCLVMLEALANIWQTDGNFEESAALFRKLIAHEPDSPKNALRQSKIVDLVSRGGSKRRTVAESKKLVALVRGVEAAGAEASVLEEARLLSENTLRRMAQIWNKEARKTRSSRTRGYALEMYEDYMSLFAESKFAYEMRFQLADLYFKVERFDEAAKAYRATVLDQPEGKYVVQAATDNILAIEEHLRDLQLKAPSDSTEPVELPPAQLRLVEACDRYLELVPAEKADQLVAVKFKAAKAFYDYNRFDEALPRFQELVSKHPDSEQAAASANLVVDVHNLKEDWAELYGASAAFLDESALVAKRPRLRKDLQKYAQFAKFKLVSRVEASVKAGTAQPSDVARAYEDFHQEFPASENADKALFNASVAWDKSGDRTRADELREQLLSEYPDSPLRADVAHYLAKQHQERTEYQEAAQAYAAFADAYPKDERARDALFDAAVFHAGTGRVREAERLRRVYLSRYGRTEGGESESAAIHWAMAADLERANELSRAAARYADFRKFHPRDERVWDALWKEAQLRRRLRQVGKARRLEAEIVRLYRRTREPPPAARRWRAQIALEEARDSYRRYLRTEISRPDLRRPTVFQRALQVKAQQRDRALEAYTDIVSRYKDPESSIAALAQIAKSWDHFVEAVVSVPCPRGVDQEACVLVKQGLEETVAPARQASLDAYQTCVDRARELQIYGQAAEACRVELQERGLSSSIDGEPELSIDLSPGPWTPEPHGPMLQLPARPSTAVEAPKEAAP
ncbi:MAG: tetratricopeptide repeat protein [Myxococcota bacterium]